jgi:DNA-directed RNA polymerase specialized sigma24 family protein
MKKIRRVREGVRERGGANKKCALPPQTSEKLSSTSEARWSIMQFLAPQGGLSWQVCAQAPVRLAGVRPRGTQFQHELLLAVRGSRDVREGWMRLVASTLERTLHHLLGPDAPLPELLESTLFEAAATWPPPRDEPLSIWMQRIAARASLLHLSRSANSVPVRARPERPGGVREVLVRVYGCLRTLLPEAQVALALLDMDGRALNEAAAILQLSPAAIRKHSRGARRHLAFVARRDPLIARYLRISARLRALAHQLAYQQHVRFSEETSGKIRAEVEAEVQWFVQAPSGRAEH